MDDESGFCLWIWNELNEMIGADKYEIAYRVSSQSKRKNVSENRRNYYLYKELCDAITQGIHKILSKLYSWGTQIKFCSKLNCLATL